MTEFHDWDDIRAELADGDIDALAAERARTEAWVSAWNRAEGTRESTRLVTVVPAVLRVNRTAIGSLPEQLDLGSDWDSPQTNAEIAADFETSD